MQKILIPTDFSEEAENAIQTAIPIAKAFKATLVLLHVLEVASRDSFSATADTTLSDALFIHEGLKLAQQNLNRSLAVHGLDTTDEIAVERYIRIGSVNRQIIEFVENEKFDFLVMGTKGAWGMNDILLGTDTDKIIRKVSCPVLAVNQVVPAEAFKKIVFPTTTENKETNLIGVIKEFQQVFKAKIYLVRINTPQNFLPDNLALARLEDYAAEHRLINYETHVYSHTEEEEGIREFAAKVEGGIVAMSTSAHTGFRKLLEGSVTKEMVSHSKRPVLTMRMD